MEQLSQHQLRIINSRIILPSILIVLAIILGASRIPSGDLLMYKKIYGNLGDDTAGFILKHKTQFLVEPLYYILNIVFSKLSVNISIFQGIIFAMSGMLLAYRENKFYLFGLIFYFCFPLYLSLNLQIIRQWIGFAILLYAINNNKGITYFLIAALFHVTCWYYVGIFLLRNLSLRNISLLILTILLFYSFFSDLLLEYMVFKATKESLYGFDVSNGIPTAVSGFFLGLSYLFSSMKRLRPYLTATFLLIWFAPNGEIQFRYMYFSIMTLIYLVYCVHDKISLEVKKTLALPVIFLLLCFQFWYVATGPYKYVLF